MSDKSTLRQRFAEYRKNLAPEYKKAADTAIRSRIAALPEFAGCRALALFAADPAEPDLLPLAWQSGKILLFPRYRAELKVYEFAIVHGPQDLVPGKYHIPEPQPECPAAEAELVCRETLHLVPGVAFDLAGSRLGRGGGFYDRLLAGVTAPVCGVGYSCQFSQEPFPAESHDRNMDLAVSEKFTIQWKPVTL